MTFKSSPEKHSSPSKESVDDSRNATLAIQDSTIEIQLEDLTLLGMLPPEILPMLKQNEV